MMWLRSMKCSSSARVLVKWTLLATTGSSQPLIMLHIPLIIFRKKEKEKKIGLRRFRWSGNLESKHCGGSHTLKDPGRFMD